jgi:feruloyl-CoA synthase
MTRSVRLAEPAISVERRADRAIVVRSRQPLGPYPVKLTERLEYWAGQAPERVFLAQRSPEGGWRRITYAQTRARARRVAAALLGRGLSAERPVAVLSGNDIEHAVLELAAMYAGVAYAPVSPAYSLVSSDFAQLRRAVELVTPGLIFVSDRKQFQKAIDAVAGRIEVIDALPERDAEADVDAAHARVGPDTVAKFLFTSGSTGVPKAVINTQRMWCANQEMVRQTLTWVQDEPPLMVDWAPWHHTAGGNKDFGMVLYNGGTMYIDEGKPLPGAIETTVRNLREISPNWYFTVPKGYEMLLPYLKSDTVLRENFFRNLKALWFAGAGVAQHVFEEYKRLSREACGEEVLFLTGLGSTETAPYAMSRTWDSDDASNMGVPPPGGEIKLVPIEGNEAGKYEARIKGPHITPGYWRQPELTRQAFDEEGWYRLGDSFVFDSPEKGLLFRGRIAEDFKLATGTWVHVGPLRARIIEHFAPLVRDVVIAGEGRSEIGALFFLSGNASLADLRARLASLPNTGSSNRVARAIVLEEPPSLDAGEMTDKGSINQRAILKRRAALVDELYSNSERVLWI